MPYAKAHVAEIANAPARTTLRRSSSVNSLSSMHGRIPFAGAIRWTPSLTECAKVRKRSC